MAPPSIRSFSRDADSHTQRASFSSRISGFFGRRNANLELPYTERNTATFEVPLFLSPSRYVAPRQDVENDPPRRSRTSTRSVIEAAASVINRVRPLSLPSSSRYSSPAQSPIVANRSSNTDHRPLQLSVVNDSEAEIPKAVSSTRTPIRQRRRRRASLRRRVQSLRQLSIGFGITLLLGLITYLVLALTATASGIMFHVLTILLLLILAGVFLHCTIRLFALRRRQYERANRHHEQGWVGRQHHETSQGSHFFGEIADEVPADKPIRIIMVEDDCVDPVHKAIPIPPPVYGNFRDSKRMDPNLVHWRKVPPSPLTPTYAEAMNDVQREIGYRPPSYLISEGGATQIIETQRRDVDNALRNMHPLERERMTGLTGEAF